VPFKINEKKYIWVRSELHFDYVILDVYFESDGKDVIVMLNEKLLEILSHPVDGAVSIMTNGVDGPHLVNTWNSYIEVTSEEKLLIPAYGFLRTEKNIGADNAITLSIASREVEGYRAKGTGVIVKGSARFINSGEDFDRMKTKFDWARAVLEVTVRDVKQTL
jgi:hypothetical protein